MTILVLVLAGLLLSAAPALGSVALVPAPEGLEFGPVEVHQGATAEQPVSFVNEAGFATTVKAVGISGADAGDFAIASDGCSGSTVELAASCIVQVRSQPLSPGLKQATLTLVESGGSVELPLSATGVTGVLSASPVSFSTTRVGEGRGEQVVVQNTGAGSFVSGFEITGPDASSFWIGFNSCSGATLVASGSCNAEVHFQPSSAGHKEAQLMIPGDAENAPLAVPLSGTAASGPVLVVDPVQALLSEVPLGSSVTQRFTVSNGGDYPLQLGGAFVVSGTPLMFTVVNQTCGAEPVEPGASCTFSVRFAPTTTGSKTASVILISDASGGVMAVGLEGTGVSGQASPPAPSTPALVPSGPSTRATPQLVHVRHRPRSAVNTGIIAVCPSGVARCTIHSTIRPLRRTTRGASGARARALGSSTSTLSGGERATVYGGLSRYGQALLRQTGHLKVSAAVSITAPGSPPVSSARTLTLHASRR